MGMFNTLFAEITCENCHHRQVEQIQFKFADTWLFEYRIGDRLQWGGNDKGRPGLSMVKVLGCLVAKCCTVCRHPYHYDYDIIISHDIIKSINKATSIADYLAIEDDWCIITE